MNNTRKVVTALVAIAISSSGALLCMQTARAGSYLFAGESNGVDLVTHPTGYSGSGDDITVNICIAPDSANASNMEIAVQNVIDQFNRLVATTSNLRDGGDNEIAGNEFDFESAVLHELGHCIGLAHPNLASESGLSGDDRNYTKSTDGANNSFDLNIGADGVRGSADDTRGDDVNLHWFNIGINDPFFEPDVVDSTTYSRDVGLLPSGETFPVNADRDVASLYFVPDTEAVMQQGQFANVEQRSLVADDVNSLRYARSGADSLAGTADDYTVTLNYRGITNSNCDVGISFNDIQTAFATCRTGGIFLTSDDVAITSASIYYNAGVNWFFSTTRIPNPAEDFIIVSRGGTTTSLTGGGSSVLGNDTHPDGLILEASTTLFGGPTNGSVSINSNGTFSYTHDGSSITSDYFVYRTCTTINANACAHQVVNVTVVGTPPGAVDDAISVAEGGTTTLLIGGNDSVLDNDVEQDGDTLSVDTTPVVGPSNGSLTLNSDGTFSYTHDGGETSSDSFDYRVCDDESPQQCDTATVVVSVTAFNDPPQARNDTISLDEGDTATTLTSGENSLLANDSDPENGSLAVTTTPLGNVGHGTLTLNADGTFSYAHDGGENTTDSFTYEVCDNGPPSRCDTADVAIAINPVNDPPQARNDTISLDEGDTATTLDSGENSLLANDSDPENGSLTVTTTPIGNVGHGTLTLNADGTFRYTHDGTDDTSDSFVYEICDDGVPQECASATVSITITLVNAAPQALDDRITAIRGVSTTRLSNGQTSLLANDFDADGDNLTLDTTPVEGPSTGILALNADGTFSYTPQESAADNDTFRYRVCDDGSPQLCSTAVVRIQIVDNAVFRDGFED